MDLYQVRSLPYSKGSDQENKKATYRKRENSENSVSDLDWYLTYIKTSVLVNFSIAEIRYLTLAKQRTLFWLMVLEGSVHSQLSSKKKHHGGKGWCIKAALASQWLGSRAQEKKRGGLGKETGPQIMIHGPLPSTRPHLLISCSAMNLSTD